MWGSIAVSKLFSMIRTAPHIYTSLIRSMIYEAYIIREMPALNQRTHCEPQSYTIWKTDRYNHKNKIHYKFEIRGRQCHAEAGVNYMNGNEMGKTEWHTHKQIKSLSNCILYDSSLYLFIYIMWSTTPETSSAWLTTHTNCPLLFLVDSQWNRFSL